MKPSAIDPRALKATCIVTCHNYGQFVTDALESAAGQRRPFDEILVVDDGSTDDSYDRILDIAKRFPILRVLHHDEAQGQLAAFETAALRAQGDVVFFLDADDVYSPEYLGVALEIYQRFPACDFLFLEPETFATGFRWTPPNSETGRLVQQEALDLGVSIVRTLVRRVFLGAPTSALSARSWVLQRLFPLPLHQDWPTRADDCLVYGASLAGARKFRFGRALVGYRLHERNAFAGNPVHGYPEVLLLRQIALCRLFEQLRTRFELPDEVAQLAHLEFKTIPKPSLGEALEYVSIVAQNGATGASRFRAFGVIAKHYLRSVAHSWRPARSD